MNLILTILGAFVICFLFSTCAISTIKNVAEIELRSKGYVFENGWSPRKPDSKVRCKKWPEYGSHAEYCEVIK